MKTYIQTYPNITLKGDAEYPLSRSVLKLKCAILTLEMLKIRFLIGTGITNGRLRVD